MAESMTTSHLSRGSSPVDWCEENYTFSPLIAEFVNTVTNSVFILVPPFMMLLHKPYSSIIGPGINLIWILLIIVGVSSAYFHATLSLLGQLLDELAILWVVMAGFAMWCPRSILPRSLRDRHGRRTFMLMVLLLTVASTGLCFVKPSLNAFFLMALGVPSLLMLVYNLKREGNQRVLRLALRSIVVWALAVTCWITDKAHCQWWHMQGFAYLHGVWHVLIFLASYQGVVLFAYFDVKNHHKAHAERADISFWPNDHFLGIPYVRLGQGERQQQQQQHGERLVGEAKEHQM